MVQKTLEKTKKLVWPEIDKYLKDLTYPSQFVVHKKYNKEISLFWKINRDYPERQGKYLRPTLVLLTAQAMGVKVAETVKTAAAMQLSEDWILIHDDIEDNSDARRGKPALHKIYGTELAINAGDALHIVMWRMISDIKNSLISQEFNKMLLRTTIGQAVEQIWKEKKKILSKEDYFIIADSKSAYYSVAGPMRLGAIIGKVTPSQLNKITEFGFNLGRAFQMVDDILDIAQDKSEGHLTLANTKGPAYAKNEAKKFTLKAMEIFDKDLKFLSHEPFRSQLKEIANFVLSRDH